MTAERKDLYVFNFEQLMKLLNTEGVKMDSPELKPIAEFMGIKVYEDPALPDGRCEFRDPKSGELLLAFEVK